MPPADLSGRGHKNVKTLTIKDQATLMSSEDNKSNGNITLSKVGMKRVTSNYGKLTNEINTGKLIVQ